jgi:trimeric autotransporter adhesin
MIRSSLRVLAAVLAASALAACGGGGSGSAGNVSVAVDPGPQATGVIEVMHASQDAPPVNVRVAGNLVFGQLPYKGVRSGSYRVGDYAITVEGVIPGGNATVIPAAGAPEPVLGVGENQRVTVVAAGAVAALAPIVLVDDPLPVAGDAVRLRVLHAADVAPTVEVYVTAPGEPLDVPLGTFAFGELLTPDAVVVPAGEYQIRVAVPGSPPTVVFDSGTVTLPGGADLLVAAVPNVGPGPSPISLLAATGAEPLEIVDTATRSDVRVVHASPDAPNVDVVADDDFAARPVVDLAFGAATGYLGLPPGTINVKVVPSGADSPVVIDADLELAAAQTYSVYAVGVLNPVAELAPIQPLVLVDDPRRVATEARVRLLHASPSTGPVDIYVVPGGAGGILDGETPAFSAVPFLAETGYVPLAPGSYDVVVTGAGSQVPAIGPVTLELAGGGIYTAAAIDQQNVGTPPQLLLLDDLAL